MSSTFTVDTDLLDFDLLSHVLDEIDETDIPAPVTPEKKKRKGKKKLNSLEKADRCLAYSVLILKYLRLNPRGCFPIEKVCGACGIPQDFDARKNIVKPLVDAGLLYARRGKVSGGIQIGRVSPIMLDELRKIFDLTVFRFDYI